MFNEVDNMAEDIGMLFEPFAPCATHNEELDWLVYLERDCSYTSKHVPGCNIELLYDNADNQLVGVKIADWSQRVTAQKWSGAHNGDT